MLAGLACGEAASSVPSDSAPAYVESETTLRVASATTRGQPGVALSARQIEVRAPSTSTIVSVEVERGGHVRAGDVLVVLDSADAQADLRVATTDLRALERERSSARLAAKVARRRQAKIKTLHGEGYAAADGVEDADLDADQALAEVDRVDARIDALETKIRRLRTLVDEHRLRAPMDGVVADRHVDAGAVISPSATILRLISAHADRVRFAVAPEDGAEWAPGRRIEVRATDGQVIGTAMVQSTAPEVDPAANLLFVDATLDDPAKFPAGLAVWIRARGDD